MDNFLGPEEINNVCRKITHINSGHRFQCARYFVNIQHRAIILHLHYHRGSPHTAAFMASFYIFGHISEFFVLYLGDKNFVTYTEHTRDM
jgi:hypothetical protein